MVTARLATPATAVLSLFAAAALGQGCGLIQRSNSATNVEDVAEPAQAPTPETTPASAPAPQAEPAPVTGQVPQGKVDISARHESETSPPPQKLVTSKPREGTVESRFARAKQEQDDGAFLKAAELWQKFLEEDTGAPGYDRAIYNRAVCLFTLGRAAEAAAALKMLLSQVGDVELAADSRILLAESLLATGTPDEGLATTFEVLPNLAAEKEVGFARATKTPALNLIQKVRLYTIRGRIYYSLARDEEAHGALEKAQLLLVHAPRGEIKTKDFQFLTANYAWRQLEVLGLSCQSRVGHPERLSEAEFLAYADAYYGCVKPARKLYCTVLATRNEQVRTQAQQTFRSMVQAPLALRDKLPPAAREIKKPEQRSHYESEMKALIEKTVDERSRDFRNIESCGAKNVF